MKKKRIDRFISHDGDFQLTPANINRFIWQDGDFELSPINPPVNAVARQARPGFKAGNAGIDSFYDAKGKKLEERTDLFLRISRRIAHWKIVNGEKPSLFRKNISEYLSRKDKDREEVETNLRIMLMTRNNQSYLDSREIVDKAMNRLYSRGINEKVTFYYEYMIHNAEKRLINSRQYFAPANLPLPINANSSGAESKPRDVYDKMEKSITDTIKTVIGVIEKQMPHLRAEVESMITRKVTSPNIIENTLDTLLSVMDMGLGEEEFKMLNQYYSDVNKKGYQFYQREYRKLKKEK